MSGKKYDAVGLGEILIDFAIVTPDVPGDLAIGSDGELRFSGNPGGAPPNVLASLARLGKKTAFIGKVGDDMFGARLRRALRDAKIDDAGLVTDADAFTTLAFVSIDERGEREFSFARKNSADVRLSKDEVRFDLIESARVFHAGTLSLTDEPCREATLAALDCAKKAGCAISVDPNYRPPLWKSADDARDAMRLALSYAHIVKISDYEVEFLYNEKIAPEDGARRIADDLGTKLVFVTCGEKGAFTHAGGVTAFAPALADARPVDTTGAGDCFTGVALSRLIDLGLDGASFDFASLGETALSDILRFANTAAGISTERPGAIPAMPDASEIAARTG